MTYSLHKNAETIIELSDDFVSRLIKELDELANNKELSDAHERADKILLEFVPDEIKNAWQKVTKVKRG
ncbi:MAG: hypothetical protein WAL66_03770 [Nitrososphaeraceae archaeon]